MITRGVREYVARDWEAVRANKDAYWRARIDHLGAAEGLRVADELRRQVLQRDPGWPGAESRAADLSCHIRMVERFRRASAARSR